MGEKRWQTGARRRNRERIARDPLTSGWLRPDRVGGAVTIGLVSRHALSDTLTALHEAGFGHAARVLDPTRGEPRAQLARAGVSGDPGLPIVGDNQVLVLVSVPGRAVEAGDLLLRKGASEVRIMPPKIALETPPPEVSDAARSEP